MSRLFKVRSAFSTGFTLVELMIAIAVLALITAIAIPAYQNYVDNSRIAECLNEMAAINLAEQEFFLANNRFFDGADAATLETNSTGFYTPSAAAVGPAPNCTYSVVLGANNYTLTITGANALATKGVIQTYVGQ